ncbi:MAG: hypothetical protein AAB316_05975, partial [Bacteroidota bacterium]
MVTLLIISLVCLFYFFFRWLMNISRPIDDAAKSALAIQFQMFFLKFKVLAGFALLLTLLLIFGYYQFLGDFKLNVSPLGERPAEQPAQPEPKIVHKEKRLNVSPQPDAVSQVQQLKGDDEKAYFLYRQAGDYLLSRANPSSISPNKKARTEKVIFREVLSNELNIQEADVLAGKVR